MAAGGGGREVARALTSNTADPNPDNRIFGTSTFVLGSWFTAYYPLAQFGHDLMTKDKTKIAPTTPEAVEYLQFFQDLACKDHSAPARDTDGYELANDGHVNTGRFVQNAPLASRLEPAPA